jgi:hypothetical protein
MNYNFIWGTTGSNSSTWNKWTPHKNGTINTPHKNGTIKYTIQIWEIKTNKYMKITLIYRNKKEKKNMKGLF